MEGMLVALESLKEALLQKMFPGRKPRGVHLYGAIVKKFKMLVGGHGEANPNTNWLESRGLWFSYCLGMLALHIVLLSIPFLTVPVAWTATNVFHNLIHLIFLHTLKGTPWVSQDQGDCQRLTHWEQIDDGLQFTKTKKFLFIVPVVLFFLANFYTKYDPVHFYINFFSLVVVLLPKLPHFHKRGNLLSQ